MDRKTRVEIAKCQTNAGELWKCDHCSYRFVCFTERIDPTTFAIPSWVFYVPNTKEGRLFVKLVKKYKNKDVLNVKVRGRAKDRVHKGGKQSFQPLKKADAFAIYLHPSPLAKKRWTLATLGERSEKFLP